MKHIKFFTVTLFLILIGAATGMAQDSSKTKSL